MTASENWVENWAKICESIAFFPSSMRILRKGSRASSNLDMSILRRPVPSPLWRPLRRASGGKEEIETIDVELVERFHNGVTDFGDVLAEIGRILDAQSSRPSARLRSYAFRPSP